MANAFELITTRELLEIYNIIQSKRAHLSYKEWEKKEPKLMSKYAAHLPPQDWAHLVKMLINPWAMPQSIQKQICIQNFQKLLNQ